MLLSDKQKLQVSRSPRSFRSQLMVVVQELNQLLFTDLGFRAEPPRKLPADNSGRRRLRKSLCASALAPMRVKLWYCSLLDRLLRKRRGHTHIVAGLYCALARRAGVQQIYRVPHMPWLSR